MKKTIKTVFSAFLVALITFISGCGSTNEVDVLEKRLSYKRNSNQAAVYTPMSERPNYALKEGASVEEMREMAVKVMYDELSFLWTPLESFTYTKTGAGEKNVYYFGSDTVFAGMPYTSAGLSLFHMLDLYDPSNGVLYGLNGGDANILIGNNCAPSVNWGLSAVCTNISASDTGSMTEKNGFVPIGGYDISYISRFDANNPTTAVIERVGVDKMYECLAQVVTADALVTNPVGSHAMMAIKPANVVRNENGAIDPEKSTITIQDQRFGEKITTLNGQTVSYRGRYDAELSFKYLLDEGYIPLRAAELDDPNHKYVKPQAKLSSDCKTSAELKKATVNSNFRVCKIEGKLVSDSGKTVFLMRKNTGIQDYYSGKDKNMDVKSVLPSKKDVEKFISSGHKYNYMITALFADGEEVTLFDKEVKASFFE